MAKSTESSVTPARSSRSAGDRIESEGIGSGSSSGGRSRRPVPDSPQHMAARKRRHSEVDTADDQGGEQQPGNDAEAAADAGVATPAAKHARRSLFGTVSNLVGRAVGLFTPGRAHPPAEGSPSPTGGDSTPEVAVRDEAEQDQADGEEANQLDETDLVDKPDDHNELPPGAAVTTTSTFEPPGEEALNSHAREESLPRPAATTGGTSHGPGDTSLGLTDESTENNDGERETVTQPVVASRSALRDPASSSPFISGALSAEDALIERMLPLGTFRTEIRRASEAGARMPSATIGSLASPVSRRVSIEGQGLKFASIRRSTTGDDETDAPVPTPHSPRRGDLYAVKSALSAGPRGEPGRRVDGAIGGNQEEGTEGETEIETDHSLTPTQQRDLIRALRFRRGLPPAVAMYILSKMESESASAMRDQILREHHRALSAAQETSVVGRGAAPVPAERALPLHTPIARRPNAPVDELARAALSVSTLMPPPSSSRRASMEASPSTSGIGGSRRLSLAARAGGGGDVRTPMRHLDDGVDLLSPSRRAQLARERAARERSFALGTPGGARMWKRATSSTQGTPWAGRVHQRSNPFRPKAPAEERLGRSGLWSNTPSKNEPRTPAEQTRRIISVLEDLSTPVSLHRPGPSAACNAQASRSSSYADDEPLPTKTLSVPHPFGDNTPWSSAPTALNPARLPPSRWAPRRESRGENLSAKSEGAEGDATPLTTRKRKTSDEFSHDIGRENRSAGPPDQASDAAPDSTSEGPSDGLGVSQPFVKRARTSSDGAPVVTAAEPAGKKDGDGSKGPGGGDTEGEEVPKTPAKVTLDKSGGAEGGESSSRKGEDAAEKEKTLASRRREGRHSLPSKKTAQKPQPKIALPMSLRLSDVEAQGNLDMGADGGMLSAMPKTPIKFWTCSGCYTRNFDFSAKFCNMCRYAKDVKARPRNTYVSLRDRRIMYNRMYNDDPSSVGPREGRLVSKDTVNSTNEDNGKAETAEVSGESPSVAAATPAPAPAPVPTVIPSSSPKPSTKPTVTFQEPDSDAYRRADQAVVATPQPPPTIEKKAPAPAPTAFTFNSGEGTKKTSSGFSFTTKTPAPAAQGGASAKTFIFDSSKMSSVASQAHATAPSTTGGKSGGFVFVGNTVSAPTKASTAAPSPSLTVKPAFDLTSSQFTFTKPAQVATSATLPKPSFFPATSVATIAPAVPAAPLAFASALAGGKESSSSSNRPVTSLAAPSPAAAVFNNSTGFVFNPAQHKRTSSPAIGDFNQALGPKKRVPSSLAQVAPINPFFPGPTQTPTMPQAPNAASSHAAVATPSQSFARHSNQPFAGPVAMPAPMPAFASPIGGPVFNMGPPGRKVVRARRNKGRK